MVKRKNKIRFARKLRKDQTKAERKLWYLLKDRRMLGHKFRRQYLFRGFIIDYYCSLIKLAIEIDGGVHLKKKEYDRDRQKILEMNGIKVIRFTNTEVFREPEKVLNEIVNHLPIDPLLEKERGDPDKVGVGEV